MNKYRYKGTAERVFPYAHPPVVVSPGDVIEHPDNLDDYWFERVHDEPEDKPIPPERVDEEES